jgi:hypothetical protein
MPIVGPTPFARGSPSLSSPEAGERRVGNLVIEIELAEPSAAKVQFDLPAQTALVSDVPKVPLQSRAVEVLPDRGRFWADWVEIHPREFEVSARELLASRGPIKPVISRRFSLDEGARSSNFWPREVRVDKIMVIVD